MQAPCSWLNFMRHEHACITNDALCRSSDITSADTIPRRERGREAVRSTLKSQRSTSLETGKSRIRMGKKTRQVRGLSQQSS